MTWDVAREILLDTLKDSALVLAFVFVFHIILALFENKMSKILTNKRVLGPIFGSIFGLIPQCGTSVLAADLYIKKYITLGTIIAVFLSCSDEALLVLITNAVTSPSEKSIMILPLIASKLVIGILIGMLIDLLYKKQDIKQVEEELEDVTCEDHHHHNVKLHKYLIHPLVHSLEIFAYVFVINVVLGLIIASVGEANFANFIASNKYASPLYASLIGLIPNCASSVLLCELYTGNSLAFGSLLAGLLVNAGLGVTVLLKSKSTWKKAGLILLITFVTALAMGYIFSGIMGF